ncbi:sulfatase/phosphatase domain-containing protein [Planobispora siamensis]|uniref:N-sulphoglucosamine sulphohydrolase C-terminal domain-containing protein n=1 Tax=Planobispora siamensis TaxID=936338 RepID=A0A8J3SFE5_9ACTN|nr:sulfatase/phosphatase domain-containing protein [Planobispora siamensis]GIH93233.1 hypothetical protein Psi01_38630 [Planobispora siamensis]
MEDCLAVAASADDNAGRVVDWLREPGESDDALLMYCSAQTVLDAAVVAHHPRMQGRSSPADLTGEPGPPPAEGMYYRHWEHDDIFHKAPAHYGYRTARYEIICFHNDGMGVPGTGVSAYGGQWEPYDLEADPAEPRNVYHDPDYLGV